MYLTDICDFLCLLKSTPIPPLIFPPLVPFPFLPFMSRIEISILPSDLPYSLPVSPNFYHPIAVFVMFSLLLLQSFLWVFFIYLSILRVYVFCMYQNWQAHIYLLILYVFSLMFLLLSILSKICVS